MTIDPEIVRWILMAAGGLLLWFWKRQISTNQLDLNSVKIDIQNLKDTRLHKDDFKDFKIELRAQFDEIKMAIRDLKPHA